MLLAFIFTESTRGLHRESLCANGPLFGWLYAGTFLGWLRLIRGSRFVAEEETVLVGHPGTPSLGTAETNRLAFAPVGSGFRQLNLVIFAGHKISSAVRQSQRRSIVELLLLDLLHKKS